MSQVPSQKVGVEAFGFFNNDFFKGIGNGIGNGIGDHIKKINFNGLLTSVVSGGGKHHPPSPPQPEIPAEQDSQPIRAAAEVGQCRLNIQYPITINTI